MNPEVKPLSIKTAILNFCIMPAKNYELKTLLLKIKDKIEDTIAKVLQQTKPLHPTCSDPLSQCALVKV